MELATRVTGKMTFNMVKVWKPGLTAPATKVNTVSVANMESALTNGTMGLNTLATGPRTRLAGLASTAGSMAETMRASGKATIWRDSAYTCGTMDASMKDSIRMIRNMDLVYILGLMAGAMKGTGGRANSMAWAPI